MEVLISPSYPHDIAAICVLAGLPKEKEEANVVLQRALKSDSLRNGRADIEDPGPSDWKLRMDSKQLYKTIVLSRCRTDKIERCLRQRQ
jgi:hypothetical protein